MKIIVNIIAVVIAILGLNCFYSSVFADDETDLSGEQIDFYSESENEYTTNESNDSSQNIIETNDKDELEEVPDEEFEWDKRYLDYGEVSEEDLNMSDEEIKKWLDSNEIDERLDMPDDDDWYYEVPDVESGDDGLEVEEGYFRNNDKNWISSIDLTNIYCEGVSFTDIEDNWGKEYILKLARNGIINGYGDGTFKPNKTITRAEFFKLLESAKRGGDFFEYFSKGTENWYDSYFDWASRDLIFEKPEDVDEPNALVTRKEAAMAFGKLCEGEELMYYFNNNFYEQKGIEEKDKFIDTMSFNGNEHFYMNYVTEIGIVDGYEDGTFKPEKYLTRVEVSKLIYTYIIKARKEYNSANSEDISKINEKLCTTIYRDVAGHPYENSINILSKINIIEGFDDKTFKPDSSITIGDFYKWLIKAFKGKDILNDYLNEDEIKKACIDFALSEGLVLQENGTLEYDAPITRKQAMISLAKLSIAESLADNQFEDDYELRDYIYVSDKYEDTSDFSSDEHYYLNYVTDIPIFNITQNNCFYPNNNLTRAESAKLIYNYMLWAGKSWEIYDDYMGS